MTSMGVDGADARVDRLIGQVLAERADEIWADADPAHVFQVRLATPQGTASRWATPRGLLRLGVVGLALLGLIAGLVIAAGTLRQTDRLVIVEQLVDAANRRDVLALAPLFRSQGSILELPKVSWVGGPEVYMSDDAEFDPLRWVADLDTWGFEGVIEGCTGTVDVVSCDVRTRWHVVQVEIGERWVIRFERDRISYLGMFRSNLRPPNPTLPLVVVDLDDWAVWVREAHPEIADRLAPNSSGYYFPQPYFLFALEAGPTEIGASIREYVETRP